MPPLAADPTAVFEGVVAVDDEPRDVVILVDDAERGLDEKEPLDRVVERIEEHPPTELTIGDHVQPRVDLPPERFDDGLVLERPQLGSVPGPLLGLQRAVAALIERLDCRLQLRRPEQRADRLGPGRAARPHRS